MNIQTTRSSNGAVDEYRTLGKEPNRATLPEAIHLFDASSPVPNLRAVEILTVAWAARQSRANLSLDVMTSGTILEYGHPWRMEPLEPHQLTPWLDFYSKVSPIKKFRLRTLAPFALVPDAGKTIAEGRMRAIREMSDLLDQIPGPYGTENKRPILSRVKVVDLLAGKSIPFGALAENVPFGKSIGQFVCPACSPPSPENHFASIPSHHSVRTGTGGFRITKGGSTGEIKCQGAKAWLAQVKPETDLTTLVHQTGFSLNGMAAFNAIHRTLQPRVAKIVRDYSNPRGIAHFANKLWPEDLWFSTRITVRNKDEQDIPWERLQTVAPHWARTLADALDEVPFLSDGRSIAITF